MAASFPHEPKPVPPAATRHDGTSSMGRPKTARLTPFLATLLFVVVFVWASGHLEKAAALGFRLFDLYAQSQLAMLRAAGNVVDGRAEYAVLVRESATIAALKARLGPAGPLRYERESALPGWIVVSVEDGDRDAVAALKSAPFARAVVRNRGLWICH